ncbi:DICT sensory domain-containing protein [Natronorarus salvus]|uniref:DICT sensory domain-containing protein n=1 Tax=Natronorarus salvus TaxID=3117733 RepID=UPI002F26C436
MSLLELISGVEEHEQTLTVFNADEATTRALSERFSDRNLVVRPGTAEGGPETFAALERDGEFVAGTSVATMLAEDEAFSPAFDPESYRPILDELDESVFTSYSMRQMIAASREIEDRAWRIGRGELHSGFQRVSILERTLDVYERLGEREGLSVHGYASPDADPPRQDSFTLHLERASEIERTWFVAYDGGGVDENKCALLAEEREPREFYGFWTYDPETVDYIVDHLKRSYLHLETDGGRSPGHRGTR